jgi:hypothetical protein
MCHCSRSPGTPSYFLKIYSISQGYRDVFEKALRYGSFMTMREGSLGTVFKARQDRQVPPGSPRILNNPIT